MSELVSTSADRPAFVRHKGVMVVISVHDAYFRDENQRRRALLVDAHPDKGGTAVRFIREKKRYDAWLAEEAKWYAEYGLEPPGKSAPVVAVAPDAIRAMVESVAKPKAFETRRRIAAHLAAHPDDSNAQIAAALGLRADTVAVSRHRMQQPPTRTNPTQPQRLLQLLADQRPHSVSQCAAVAGLKSGRRVRAVLNRLVPLGFDIVMIRRGRESFYQLLIGDLAKANTAWFKDVSGCHPVQYDY